MENKKVKGRGSDPPKPLYKEHTTSNRGYQRNPPDVTHKQNIRMETNHIMHNPNTRNRPRQITIFKSRFRKRKNNKSSNQRQHNYNAILRVIKIELRL